VKPLIFRSMTYRACN